MLLGKGAEAELRSAELLGLPVAVKDRIKKAYRIPELDIALRTSRTKQEARLLHAAKAALRCPVVYDIGEFDIKMSLYKGRLLRDAIPKLPRKQLLTIMKAIGQDAARLHDSGIVHGDMTPANIMLIDNEPAWIDFGLGEFSQRLEDKAVDVLLMKRGLADQPLFTAFLEGYKLSKKAAAVLGRAGEIERRGRYVARGQV